MTIEYAVIIDNKDSFAWGEVRVDNQFLNNVSDEDRFGTSPLTALGPQGAGLALALRVPVFTKGEILILRGGREMNGPMRKPDKWDVEYETFDNIFDAMDRAEAVSRG